MRKFLLVLPILAAAAALPGAAEAAPAAGLARPDALALTLATPDTATETVQYYRDNRGERFRAREAARRRAEARRRAAMHRRHGYYR